ncbi:MAG: AhpC/TSA family protein [Bacteroidetes bacterium]|nr:AhpC/TSA family protein [Bacteroidota bacterium]
MKQFFNTLFLLFVIVSGCHVEPEGFIIEGTITGAPDKIFYLSSDSKIIDSTRLEDDGRFVFTGQTSMPDFFYLYFTKENRITLLVDSLDRLTVNAQYPNLFKTAELSGSEDALRLGKLFKKYIEGLDRLAALPRVTKEDPDSVKQKAMEAARAIYLDQRTFLYDFVQKNSNSLSVLAAFGLSLQPPYYILTPREDYALFKLADDSLAKYHPGSKHSRMLRAMMIEEKRRMDIETARSSGVNTGNEAPDFTLPDPNGKDVTLSSLRGQYVLLDFWASWCAPCRRENPYLVSAYNKFHNKGFEIFQVSLDKTKDAWLNGIRQDNLGQWVHGSDLSFWQCVPAQMYGVQSIPANFLIDRDGKIIGSDLRGAALEARLAELLK